MKISEAIVQKMKVNKIIEKDDVDIYSFGIECMLLKAIHYISYIVIAFLLDMKTEIFILAVVFLPLRKNAGGFHAETKLGCYLFSCTVITIALCILRFVNNEYIFILSWFISNIIIIILAPVDNESKKLDYIEKNHFKFESLKVLMIQNICLVIIYCLSWNCFWKIFVIGVAMEALLVLMGKLKLCITKKIDI